MICIYYLFIFKRYVHKDDLLELRVICKRVCGKKELKAKWKSNKQPKQKNIYIGYKGHWLNLF